MKPGEKKKEKFQVQAHVFTREVVVQGAHGVRLKADQKTAVSMNQR